MWKILSYRTHSLPSSALPPIAEDSAGSEVVSWTPQDTTPAQSKTVYEGSTAGRGWRKLFEEDFPDPSPDSWPQNIDTGYDHTEQTYSAPCEIVPVRALMQPDDTWGLKPPAPLSKSNFLSIKTVSTDNEWEAPEPFAHGLEPREVLTSTREDGKIDRITFTPPDLTYLPVHITDSELGGARAVQWTFTKQGLVKYVENYEGTHGSTLVLAGLGETETITKVVGRMDIKLRFDHPYV